MDTLGKGQQLRGQQGAGSYQVTQNPDYMSGVPLRDQQDGPGDWRAALFVILGGNLRKEITRANADTETVVMLMHGSFIQKQKILSTTFTPPPLRSYSV